MGETGDTPYLFGTWRSRYEYSSGENGGPLLSEHLVTIDHRGRQVLIKNQGDLSGSFLTLELVADGNLLTGTWKERTSPRGEYHGKTFRGAVQFILDEAGLSMHGMWVGHNRDKTEVKSGPWTIEKLPPNSETIEI